MILAGRAVVWPTRSFVGAVPGADLAFLFFMSSADYNNIYFVFSGTHRTSPLLSVLHRKIILQIFTYVHVNP